MRGRVNSLNIWHTLCSFYANSDSSCSFITSLSINSLSTLLSSPRDCKVAHILHAAEPVDLLLRLKLNEAFPKAGSILSFKDKESPWREEGEGERVALSFSFDRRNGFTISELVLRREYNGFDAVPLLSTIFYDLRFLVIEAYEWRETREFIITGIFWEEWAGPVRNEVVRYMPSASESKFLVRLY